MIKQTMMYGSSVWVSTSVDNLNKVFRLQKRAARVILNADTRANSVDLFRELNWLPFFHEAKTLCKIKRIVVLNFPDSDLYSSRKRTFQGVPCTLIPDVSSECRDLDFPRFGLCPCQGKSVIPTLPRIPTSQGP